MPMFCRKWISCCFDCTVNLNSFHKIQRYITLILSPLAKANAHQIVIFQLCQHPVLMGAQFALSFSNIGLCMHFRITLGII